MSNKNKYLSLVLLYSFCTAVYGSDFDANKFQVEKFRNDKEVQIIGISESETEELRAEYSAESNYSFIEERVYEALQKFALNINSKLCDNSFADILYQEFSKQDPSSQQLITYIKLARINNSIDNLLYEIIINIITDQAELEETALNTIIPKNYRRSSFRHIRRMKPYTRLYTAENEVVINNDLTDVFKGFAVWPNNYDQCLKESYQDFISSIKMVTHERDIEREDLSDLRVEAFLNGIISLPTYHKMTILKDLKTINSSLPLKKYMKTIQKAKNSLVPSNRDLSDLGELKHGDIYASEIINNDMQLTRREALYKKYDNVQIGMLALILKNASRRIGTDPDYNLSSAQIVLKFNRNYVERHDLSSQDLYSLARNLLQTDMRRLEESKRFFGKRIFYEDVIMAALETGYITNEEISYVLEYDNTFNPEPESGWKSFRDYTFNILQISTLYLPPPWNVLGSIAMVVAEERFNSNNRKGADHENPYSIIR